MSIHSDITTTTTASTTASTNALTHRLALIVASVRPHRMADPILGWLRPALEARADVELDVIDLATAALAGLDLVPGGATTPISHRLAAADGFVILTPEYNHSFPAALKHALDLHVSEWARKPVGFVSYGGGSGGIRAVEQLRQILPEIRATSVREAVHLVAPWERLDARGRFVPGDGAEAALAATLDELGWWALALRPARRTLLAS